MVLIGGWRAKYLKARQKPKRQIYEEYANRNRTLPVLGYANYREYLASEDWRSIKTRLLERHQRCLLCNKRACVVHHLSYDERTLLGLDTSLLVCLCDPCHEAIEIEQGGVKRSLRKANEELMRLAREQGRNGWVEHTLQSMKAQSRQAEKDRKANGTWKKRKRKR